ncbi:MAG: alpha/beta fold hydrolase [Pseudonocardiaceae bacterium]
MPGIDLGTSLGGLSVAVHHAPSSRGIAVLIPGFLDSKDYASSVALARKLTTIGITAVRFDPRGTWQSGDCPADCTTTQQIHDVTAILDSVSRIGHDRRILIGYCYGAYVAALSAAFDERVTEVVAIMPTHSFIWAEDYNEEKDTWRFDGERCYVRDLPASAGSATVHVPYSVVEDAKGHLIADVWEKLHQPILFVAGEGDSLSTPDGVRVLHAKCGSQRKNLAVLPGVSHDYRYDARQIERVDRAVLEWLLKQPSAMGGK